jgi:hypothetical protein
LPGRPVNDALRSAEFGLLAACCRWPVSEAAVRVAATEIDWDALLKLAMRQRVSGLVHRALMAAEIVPPPAAAAELARRADTIAQRNAMQAAETVRLQGLLARAGIASLALKGAALAQLAYGTLDLKHARDIDLLVLPAQAEAALHVLEDDRYALRLPAARLSPAQRRAVMRYGKDVELVHRGGEPHVELQWRASPNAHLLHGVDARAPAQDVVLPQGVVRTLAPRELFAYLCVHGASHSWSRLKWLADLNALIENKSNVEIVALYRYAQSLGAGLCAGQALLLCEKLLALKLPVELAVELRRDPRLKKLLGVALQAMAQPSAVADRGIIGVAQEVLAQFRLGRGWGFVGEQCRLAAVGIDDVVRVPLPPLLVFLYPLMRLPLWLWRRLRWAAR